MRPLRPKPPARVARLGRQAERSVAAEGIGIVHLERPGAERGRVDPGEETRRPAAARIQAKRPAGDDDSRIGAEPARIGEVKAKLGPGEVHVGRRHVEPGEVLRHREARLSADRRLVDDRFVDRAFAALGPHFGSEIGQFGSEGQLLPHHP